MDPTNEEETKTPPVIIPSPALEEPRAQNRLNMGEIVANDNDFSDSEEEKADPDPRRFD